MGLRRFLKPSILLRRKALRSGLFGGQKGWMGIWFVMFLWRRIKSLFGFGEPEPVLIEDIEPGQRFVVAHEPSSSRRKVRKAEKKDRKLETKVLKAQNKAETKAALKAERKAGRKAARKVARKTAKAAARTERIAANAAQQ